MFKKILKLMFIFLMIIYFSSCEKKSPTGPDKSYERVLESWNNHCDIQENALVVFDSLLVSGDTLASINSTIQNLLKNTNQVEEAVYNDYNAIIITYKDGKEGGILISELETEGLEKVYFQENMDQVIPSKNGAIFLALAYDEFKKDDDLVFQTMNNELPDVGFPEPQKVIDVSPISLTNLSNNGVIHISAHGVPKPTINNIHEVWLVLSIPQTKEMIEDLVKDIDNNSVLLATLKTVERKIIHSIGIIPKFITDHNNFQKDHPIIYGDFCFGFLGTWPQSMVSSGASCYISWDWIVRAAYSAECAKNFYEFMCEKPVTDPFATTVVAYWCNYQPRYVRPQDNHLVQWCFNGDPLSSFQETVPSGWTVGSSHPEFGTAAASYMPANDELDVVFVNLGQELPTAGFGIYNISSVGINNSVIPYHIYCVINFENAVYSNMDWQNMDNPKPCYVMFTKLDLQSFGKISGYIFGYIFSIYDQAFVPITASFENVTVYSTAQKSLSYQNKTTFNYLNNIQRIRNR